MEENWFNGGNGDGTGLGAPSNVVQPSIAMGYIIKDLRL